MRKCSLSNNLRFRQQLTERIIHTCDTEIRLPSKGTRDVARCASYIAVYLHDSQDELVRLVQCCQYLILSECHSVRTSNAAFHLDEAQLTGTWHLRLDIIAALLGAHVTRYEAQRKLICHHGLHCRNLDAPRLTGLDIKCFIRLAAQLRKQSHWDHQHAAGNDGRQC